MANRSLMRRTRRKHRGKTRGKTRRKTRRKVRRRKSHKKRKYRTRRRRRKGGYNHDPPPQGTLTPAQVAAYNTRHREQNRTGTRNFGLSDKEKANLERQERRRLANELNKRAGPNDRMAKEAVRIG